jgi:DNA-binding NarL/FixJ family response regulator
VGECLEALALGAAVTDESEAVARLLGAAAAQRARLGAPMSAPERGAVEPRLSAARVELGQQAFEAAWEHGARMTLDEAVAYARALCDRAADAPSDAPRLAQGRRTDLLSPREREVAALLARGLTNAAIAEALVISERTVHRHVANILDKLDLRSRAQVAVWAAERGLSAPSVE